MSKIILLTKVLLKTSLGSITGTGKKKDRTNMWMLGIVAVSLLPVLIGLITFISKGYNLLNPLQQTGIILSLGIVASGFVIFFFGIFYVISTFYFSMDIENLIPLPFKPSQIIAAKFIVVVVYEYVVELLFLGPILVVYGIKSSAGLVYYIYALLTFLALPVIPLAFASIIVMILMRFVNIGKKKDLFKLLGSFLAIGVAVGVNIAIQKFANNALDEEFILNALIEGNNSFVRIISNLFPGLSYAATGLSQSNTMSGLYDMLIFFAMTFGLFALFIVLGERLYFKGVLGISESDSKKKELTDAEMAKSSAKNSALRTYVAKELRVLFRTPAFLLNCVITNFLWPVFLLIPLLSGSGDLGSLPNLGNLIAKNNAEPLVVAIGFAAIIFASSSNGITATAISREGDNFFTNKYIPLSYTKQITGKIIPGIILSTVASLLLLIVTVFLLSIPLYLAMIIFVLGILGTLMCSMLGIVIDIFNPKLVWDNEQKAVKQNLNVLFHLLSGVIIAGLIILLVVLRSLSFAATTTVIIGFTVGVSILLYKLLTTKGVQVYGNIVD